MAAETYAAQASMEESLRVRATITDLQGKLKLRDWEPSSADSLEMVWLVDCHSLAGHLKSPTSSKCSDNRPSVGGLGAGSVADAGRENRGLIGSGFP